MILPKVRDSRFVTIRRGGTLTDSDHHGSVSRWASYTVGRVVSSIPSSCEPTIEGLEEVDGEIEDPEGHLAVLSLALLHLMPRWQDLGVLDDDQRLTQRGAWGLPQALHRIWSEKG